MATSQAVGLSEDGVRFAFRVGFKNCLITGGEVTGGWDVVGVGEDWARNAALDRLERCAGVWNRNYAVTK